MSARVPLIIHYPPLFVPRRVRESVSTLDLPATLVSLAGGRLNELLPMDGHSLYPSLVGRAIRDEVFGEYMGEGTVSPVVMIHRGRYKYTTSLVDPPQLFDLEADPLELYNLASSEDAQYFEVAARFAEEARQKWDLKRIHEDVLVAQRRRRLCWSALTQGRFESWDYEPPADASQKYAPQPTFLQISANKTAGTSGRPYLWTTSNSGLDTRLSMPWAALTWPGSHMGSQAPGVNDALLIRCSANVLLSICFLLSFGCLILTRHMACFTTSRSRLFNTLNHNM